MGGQVTPLTASSATLALNDELCFLRLCNMSCSSAVLDILEAELSLNYLSSFWGPPHTSWFSGPIKPTFI